MSRDNFQLLLDTRCNFQLLRQKRLHHGGNIGFAHDLGVFQLAGQKQVIGAAGAYGDAHAGLVHISVGLDGGVVRDQIAALNQHIGRGKGDFSATQRVDGEKTDIGGLIVERGDGFGCTSDDDQFEFDTEASRQLLCQIDRHADRLVRRRVQIGQNRVAQVDGGTQFAGGAQGGGDGSGWHKGEKRRK